MSQHTHAVMIWKYYWSAQQTLCYLLQAAELLLMAGMLVMVGVFGVKLEVL